MKLVTLDPANKRKLRPDELMQVGIPKRYWGLTREKLMDHSCYQKMHDYILDMKTVLATGESMFIFGPTNSRKTSVAAYIAKVFREYGTTVCFASAYQIHDDIERRVFNSADEELADKSYREVQLLVIDSLGDEAALVRRGSHIVQLFSDRVQNERPTILTCTANDVDDKIMEIYPPHFGDRLLHNCIPLRCTMMG